MEVIHPSLNKPVPVVGVLYRDLVAKYFDYDLTVGRKLITFSPKDNDAIITMNPVPGGPAAITVVGTHVTLDFDPGVSTVGDMVLLVTGNPAADALMVVSGTLLDVLPVGFAGGTHELWEERAIPPALVCVKDADGNVVPMSGASFTIVAAADLDTTKQCVEVDLNVDRSVAGGLEITRLGSSLVGRNLAVVSTDGDFILRFDANTTDPIPQTKTDHGSFEDTSFSAIWLEHAPLGAGKKAYLYVGRKV